MHGFKLGAAVEVVRYDINICVGNRARCGARPWEAFEGDVGIFLGPIQVQLDVGVHDGGGG